ncbi:hypothetical protein HDU96_008971 [Phlyctochytrium bullatum]|nr:hypothetical protein HDU96_008971 [Phlyctochytrium bullatum]
MPSKSLSLAVLFGVCILQAASPARAFRLFQAVESPQECDELARLANFRCAIADIPDSSACFARAEQSQQNCRLDVRAGASANFRFVYRPEATAVLEPAAADQAERSASDDVTVEDSISIAVTERSQGPTIVANEACTTSKCCTKWRNEYMKKCPRSPECQRTFQDAEERCLNVLKDKRNKESRFAAAFDPPVIISEKGKAQYTGKCTDTMCCEEYYKEGSKLCDAYKESTDCSNTFETARSKCVDEFRLHKKEETVFSGVFQKFKMTKVYEPRRVLISTECTSPVCCADAKEKGYNGCGKNELLNVRQCLYTFNHAEEVCNDGLDQRKGPSLFNGEYVALDQVNDDKKLLITAKCTFEDCCSGWNEDGYKACDDNFDGEKWKVCAEAVGDAVGKCHADYKKSGVAMFLLEVLKK